MPETKKTEPTPPAPPVERVDPDFPGIVRPDHATQFQQPVKVGEHEKLMAKDEGKEGIYAEPPTTSVEGATDGAKAQATADAHKAFLDRENVRTTEQAEREEGSRPKQAGGLPNADTAEPENSPTPKHPKGSGDAGKAAARK